MAFHSEGGNFLGRTARVAPWRLVEFVFVFVFFVVVVVISNFCHFQDGAP